MAKTGWKAAAASATKARRKASSHPCSRGNTNKGSSTGGGGRNLTNALPKSNASSKLSRGRPKQKNGAGPGVGPGGKRTAETVNRLKMYTSGKLIRNKEGQVVGGQYSMADRAGDVEITAATGRIQPDRRWFGNTRVVDPRQLDSFRDQMTQHQSDPYSVVLKRKKIPMGLLHDSIGGSGGTATATGAGAAGDADTMMNGKAKKAALLEQEPFHNTFGQNAQRKRMKYDQLFVSRKKGEAMSGTGVGVGTSGEEAVDEEVAGKEKNAVSEATSTASNNNKDADEDDGHKCYSSLLQTAQQSQSAYEEVNARPGIVPWGRDPNKVRHSGQGIDWHHERSQDLFSKGQSPRIWGEFYKVVDCSDIVLHVIDARNVPGTRCLMLDTMMAAEKKHKHLVFVLNKIDLVPNWVAKRWIGILAAQRPTVAFHASTRNNAFGKGALISLLQQFSKLMPDKKQISVGVVGYPNTGKSSIINTLVGKKACKVAPIPGETKIWQYITLFRRIALIDCPGVVVDTVGATAAENDTTATADFEVETVLKGVVRAERLESPEDYIDALLAKVKREHVAAQYKLTGSEATDWQTSTQLLDLIARKYGRLLKGGDPCLRSAAILMINDYQRGRLPHYVAPPELKTETETPLQAKKAVKNDDEDVTVSTTKTTTTSTKSDSKATAADSTATSAAEATSSGDDKNDNIRVNQDLDAVGQEYMHDDAEVDCDDESGNAAAKAKTTTRQQRKDEPKTDTTKPTATQQQQQEVIIGDGEWDD